MGTTPDGPERSAAVGRGGAGLRGALARLRAAAGLVDPGFYVAHNRLAALGRAPDPVRRAHFAAVGQWRGSDPSASFDTAHAAAGLAAAGLPRRGTTWATFLRDPATARVPFHPLQIAEPAGLDVGRPRTAPLRALAAGIPGPEASSWLHPLLAGEPVVAEPQLAGLYERITAARTGRGAPPARHAAVLLVNGDPHCPACTQYRVVNPLAALRASGVDACAVDARDLHKLAGTRLTADVAIIFRALWDEEIARTLDRLREAGTTLVFDVDDLFFDGPRVLGSLQPGASPRERLDARPDSDDGRARMRRTGEACDLATFPTDTLAAVWRRSGPRPAATLPSFLSAEQIAIGRAARRPPAREGDAVVIGYSAGSATHGGDFAVAAGAVAAVMRRHPATRLRVFGPLALDEVAALDDVRDRIDHDPRLTRDWGRLVTRMGSLDVNIVPLEAENAFCRCKSEVKYLEAGVVGVPTVATAVPAYERALAGRHGGGETVAGAEEWEETLERLVTDRALRTELGRRASADVAARYAADGEYGRRYAAVARDPARAASAASAADESLVFAPRHGAPSERAPVLVAVAEGAPDADEILTLVRARWPGAAIGAIAERHEDVPAAERYAPRPWRPGDSEADLATALRGAAAVVALGGASASVDRAGRCGAEIWRPGRGARLEPAAA